MNDFASAAMVRVLVQGMHELGLAAPAGAGPGAAAHARVEIDLKRAVIGAAVEQRGIECLALLGRGVHRYADEPTHQALVRGLGAADLLARWRRLERYIHSRHRVEVEALDESAGGGAARLRHVARDGLPPPLAVEDLVVIGVLAALLAANGATGIAVRAGDAQVYPRPDGAALRRAIDAASTGRWHFEWGTMAPPRPHGQGQVADLCADPGWPPVAHEASRWLAQDLMQPPDLPALAGRLGLSSRTLQRLLRGAGLSYSGVVAETRCRAGAWWLINSRAPLAEVGFVCGYADQPHFTRNFRQRVGVTPAAYREAFAAGAAALPLT